jgi:hypothetical protein
LQNLIFGTHNIDLLPQDQVFRFQRCSHLEARSQDTENQLEQIGHQDASLRRPLAASTPNRIFGTHRPSIFGGFAPATGCQENTHTAKMGKLMNGPTEAESELDSRFGEAALIAPGSE